MSQTEVQLIKNGAVVDADINGMSSSKLSGALPAISGAALTNLPASPGKAKNLIINGACLVAQRGTSSTSEGYHTVDRFYSSGGGEDEIPTQAQVDVAAGTTPYTLGFRKAFRLTNGNQTGGAGASDYLQPIYVIEAQDMANSGWNYTSSSSFITVSFWVKSSVAGDYTFNMETDDGTSYRYLMEYTLSADTWTKVTKTIPGKSDLTFNNDNGKGATLMFYPYLGSAYVQADQENNWYASSNSKYGTTSTTTWWTTDNATWEITGLQLEIGDTATDFEHRSFAQELLLCQRYYRVITDGSQDGTGYIGLMSYNYDVNSVVTQVNFIPEMRATPTADSTVGTNYYRFYRNSGYVDINSLSVLNGMSRKGGAFNNADSGSGTAGQAGGIVTNNASAKIAFSAEL